MHGAAHGESSCRSRRVQGGVWLTIIAHRFEISIAGGVKKMVRGPTPRGFFHVFAYIMCFVFQPTGE